MMGNESHSSPAWKRAGFSQLRAGEIRWLAALAIISNALIATAHAQDKVTSRAINIPDIQDNHPAVKAVKLIVPNLPPLEDKPKPAIIQRSPSKIEPFRTVSEETIAANPQDEKFLLEARRSSALVVQSDNISTNIWGYRTKDKAEQIETKRPPIPDIRPLSISAMETRPQATTATAIATAKEKMPAIDLNHATVEEIIQGIPKIDARRAQAIVQFRQLHKPFRTVDELSQVFGITDQQVDLWRTHLSVGESSE